MSSVRNFSIGFAAMSLAAACACSSDDVVLPASYVGRAQVEWADIPPFLTFGSPLKVTIRTVEGCKLGEWEGAPARFESRRIYVETRVRVPFEVPPDCETRTESHTVTVSFTGDKGTQPLPEGEWDVFVVGRNNKTVQGRVKVR